MVQIGKDYKGKDSMKKFGESLGKHVMKIISFKQKKNRETEIIRE